MHGAPLLSAATIARQADEHPHHLLEMWTPLAGHPVAPLPATGALPPHANGPRYPRTTPVATHALRGAAERGTATVAWGPSPKAEWRFHRGTWDTQHPAITFPVLAKHRSATPEAPAYPVKHRCSQLQDWQTVEWTTFHPQTAYLLQYVYGYLTQGHERTNYVRMNPAATRIIRQGGGRVCYPETPAGHQHADPPSAYTSRMASFSGTAVVAACIALHTKKVTFLEG